MPRGQMPANTRTRVSSDGGKARAALPAEQLSAINRAGAAAINSPVGLAKRIVKKWPDLGEEEQAEVLDVLVAGLPIQRARKRPTQSTPTTAAKRSR